MTQEEKELLIKDLCGRLPYGVKFSTTWWDDDKGEMINIVANLYSVNADGYCEIYDYDGVVFIEDIKPYLRTMDSMTDEEKEEYGKLWDMCNGYTGKYSEINVFDWLNCKMFDYRGLIPKGLADEAPDGMYNN